MTYINTLNSVYFKLVEENKSDECNMRMLDNAKQIPNMQHGQCTMINKPA